MSSWDPGGCCPLGAPSKWVHVRHSQFCIIGLGVQVVLASSEYDSDLRSRTMSPSWVCGRPVTVLAVVGGRSSNTPSKRGKERDMVKAMSDAISSPWAGGGQHASYQVPGSNTMPYRRRRLLSDAAQQQQGSKHNKIPSLNGSGWASGTLREGLKSSHRT